MTLKGLEMTKKNFKKLTCKKIRLLQNFDPPFSTIFRVVAMWLEKMLLLHFIALIS